MQFNRKHNRLKGYDYSKPGYYFITINVDKKLSVFGKIQEGKSVLNANGIIVEQKLKSILLRHSFIKLDIFIIMPTHIHFIISINDFIKTRNSISAIIGSFKSSTTKKIRKSGLSSFKWQRSFYDRIIRDEKEMYFIKDYIIQNPMNSIFD
jgi:putative transposase